MTIIRKPDLSLTILQGRNSTVLYDQAPMITGNHLRWSFNPELGFPPGGFTISRGDPTWGEFEPDNPGSEGVPPFNFNWEKKIGLPTKVLIALNRITGHAQQAEILRRYQPHLFEIIHLLEQLLDDSDPLPMHLRTMSNPHQGPLSRMRIMDIILMACLDPYIARIMGLYFIDREADPSKRYAYKITGHWEAKTFPLISVDFVDWPTSLPRNQALRFGAIQVIANARTIQKGQDVYANALLVQGDANPVIQIRVDFSVEEIRIEYEHFAVDWTVIPAPVWRIRLDGESYSPRVEENRLVIQRSGRAFENLEIVEGPAGHWHILSINYRERINALEDISSINYTQVGERARPRRPLIASLAAEPMPAILNEKGEVNAEASQVRISAWVQSPKIKEIDIGELPSEKEKELPWLLTAAEDSVRLMFGRSEGRTGREPEVELNVKDGEIAPALYRTSGHELILPELVGCWPFNGQFQNLKDGVAPSLIGNPRFITDHPDESNRFVLRLNGEQGVQLKGQHHLKELGSVFTLQATIKIDPTNPSSSTIIGNNYRGGLWMGLGQQPDNHYTLGMWIKNRPIYTSTKIQPNEWVTITVTYNGQKIWFDFSGTAEEPQAAEYGAVNVPAGDIVIGAESGSTASRPIMPFIGLIADVRIWQRVIHPLESQALIKKWHSFLPQQQSLAEMIHFDPKTYWVTPDREQISIKQSPQINALGSAFSIFLWAKPTSFPDNENEMTIIGNNRRQSFWMGLVKTGERYTIRVYINRKRFDSSTPISLNQWSHIGCRYDGSTLKLYRNAWNFANHTATLGPLKPNDRPIALGSEGDDTRNRFNGFIQGVQIWRKAITITEWQSRMAAIQQSDSFLKNGTYRYFVKGIDLFGRTSAWSPAKQIQTNVEPEYNAPLNVQVAFKPLKSSIISATVKTEDHEINGIPVKKQWYVLETTFPYSLNTAKKIKGYDAIVSRLNPRGEPKRIEQRFEIETTKRQGSKIRLTLKTVPFAQLVPQAEDDLTVELDYTYDLQWVWTGMQQLYYSAIKKFQRYQIEGPMNEIAGPILTVRAATPDGRVTVTFQANAAVRANELVGKKCLVGSHQFEIEGHTTGRKPQLSLHYLAEPQVVPVIHDPVKISVTQEMEGYIDYDDSEVEVLPWTKISSPMPAGEPRRLIASATQTGAVENLQEVTEERLNTELERGTPEDISRSVRERLGVRGKFGVDWFPLSRIYKITFRRFPRPAEYQAQEAKEYIPGALVFFDNQSERMQWRALYVLWHQWETPNRLVVYALPGEKDEAVPVIQVNEGRTVRLYEGKRYTLEGHLESLPKFTESPTQAYHLALTAVDGANRKSPLSRKATMVAVNRQRPPQGPRPEARIITKADYYQKCQVEVTWNSEEIDWPTATAQDVRYKLYRATDSAIYTRDLELRRTRQGYYQGLPPGDVFNDDPDFTDWRKTLSPPLLVRQLNTLFPTKDSSQWKEVTPTWRKWADRFYPALSNEQLEEIALRFGNEKAFTLLNGTPMSATTYTDQVNGVVNNRYYYRLRLQNTALAESTIWGNLSHPVIPPKVMAPRKPVFTKIEAGDRRIDLQWSLNREPDLKEYRVYRAEKREDLEDLRWWKLERDTRLVGDPIPDPRIKVSNRTCTLPGTIPIKAPLGVYRADEFNFEAEQPHQQPQALNYYYPTSSSAMEPPSAFTQAATPADNHVIKQLRRMADGVDVVVVYRDTEGDVQVLQQLGESPLFRDEGLQGLKDYYYRLVAINDRNKLSAPSLCLSSRTVDEARPAPPQWLEPIATESTVLLRWILLLPENDCVVQRLNTDIYPNKWESISSWLPTETSIFEDAKRRSGKTYLYRLKVKDIKGITNNEFITLEV